MRFASLQSGGASDYAAAGKKAANEAVSAFAVQRKSGPDYGKIAETGIKARSAEKRAGMEAASQVTKAGINAYTDVNKFRIESDAESEIRGVGKSLRKAGGIAALGGLAGAGYLATRDNEAGRERPDGLEELKAAYDEGKNRRDERTNQREANRTEFTPSEFNPSGNANGSSSSNTASVSQTGGSSNGKAANSSDRGNRYMTTLTGAGMSREQAAALTGNMFVESDGFRAYEEYSPNAYGTRGAGDLQWTNAGGSNRRSNFEKYAADNGFDPKSFEANSGFLLSELQGNYGNHWTNGASYQGFLNTKSVQEASNYLQNNYIRPGVPHTQRRLNAAQSYFDAFNS